MYHVTPQASRLHQSRCRTSACPHCSSTAYCKHGYFFRQDDGRRVQRYRCRRCLKTFSRAGFSHFYRHRYRRLKLAIYRGLADKNTIRGVAHSLGIDKDTVSRYLVLLAKECRERQWVRRQRAPLASNVQFDELITFEHSRLKPLAVMLITDSDRWRILGYTVSRIPANGLLAEKSRKKYGKRRDESVARRHELMQKVAPLIDPQATIRTDEHAAYPTLIKRHLPQATHESFKGRKAHISGQGEMKEGGFDPIFCINQQLAMCRYLNSRLVRRTWTTTKKVDRLEDHLAILIDFYNEHRRPKSGREFEAKEELPMNR